MWGWGSGWAFGPASGPSSSQAILAKVRSVRLPFGAAVIAGRAWPTGTGKLVYIALGVFVSGFRFQAFQHSNKSV